MTGAPIPQPDHQPGPQPDQQPAPQPDQQPDQHARPREPDPDVQHVSSAQRWPGELDSNVRWQPPVVIASGAAVVLSGVLLRERPPGWLGVLGVVALLLAGYLAVVWLRARARMAVHGRLLTVRRWRGVHTLRADQVVGVRQRLTGHGPDFVLRTSDGARVLVPASRLRRGHSSFFDWLLADRGEDVLDKGSRRTLDVVRQRGLISR